MFPEVSEVAGYKPGMGSEGCPGGPTLAEVKLRTHQPHPHCSPCPPKADPACPGGSAGHSFHTHLTGPPGDRRDVKCGQWGPLGAQPVTWDVATPQHAPGLSLILVESHQAPLWPWGPAPAQGLSPPFVNEGSHRVQPPWQASPALHSRPGSQAQQPPFKLTLALAWPALPWCPPGSERISGCTLALARSVYFHNQFNI